MPLHEDEEDQFSDAEDGWDIIIRCWDQLHRLCKRCCRGRYDLIDEMMGEVVTRVPSIVDNWDPTMDVPLRAKVFGDMRWYLWKWMNRRMKREVVGFVSLGDIDPEGRAPEHDSDLKDEVQEIMDSLEDWQRYILEAKLMRELTYPQIAEELGVSRGRAKQYFERALEAARRIWAAAAPPPVPGDEA